MFSIWLLPHANKHRELAQLIYELGQKNNGPCYLPHITLLSGLHGNKKGLMGKTSKLAEKMSAFSVTTDALETQDSYFKSIFLNIVKTKPLLESRQHAEALFHLKPLDEFMPHLSLLYGNQPEPVKKQLIVSLKDKTRLDLLIDRVALVSTFGPPEKWVAVSTEQLY